MSPEEDVELDEYCGTQVFGGTVNEESEPLISSVGHTQSFTSRARRHQAPPTSNPSSLHSSRRRYRPFFSSAEAGDKPDIACLDIIMDKISHSKVGRLVDKLAVESEPGLTNAQLLLTNHDLKPVEPVRRQWGAWNFVGFWIGTLSSDLCYYFSCILSLVLCVKLIVLSNQDCILPAATAFSLAIIALFPANLHLTVD